MYAVASPGLMPNYIFDVSGGFFVLKPEGRLVLPLCHLPQLNWIHVGWYISRIYTLTLLFRLLKLLIRSVISSEKCRLSSNNFTNSN